MKLSYNWKQWSYVFLPVLALAVGLELYAVFDDNGESVPLTQYIVNWIPTELGVFLVGGFSIWLIWHFLNGYYEKEKEKHLNT